MKAPPRSGDSIALRAAKHFDKAQALANFGKLLRIKRESLGLSLGDVQLLTSGEFKSSILGAYERGERAMTVDRMMRLNYLYDAKFSFGSS